MIAYVCMYIYICVWMIAYVCIYIYICVCVNDRVCVYVYIYIYVCVCDSIGAYALRMIYNYMCIYIYITNVAHCTRCLFSNEPLRFIGFPFDFSVTQRCGHMTGSHPFQASLARLDGDRWNWLSWRIYFLEDVGSWNHAQSIWPRNVASACCRSQSENSFLAVISHDSLGRSNTYFIILQGLGKTERRSSNAVILCSPVVGWLPLTLPVLHQDIMPSSPSRLGFGQPSRWKLAMLGHCGTSFITIPQSLHH